MTKRNPKSEPKPEPKPEPETSPDVDEAVHGSDVDLDGPAPQVFAGPTDADMELDAQIAQPEPYEPDDGDGHDEPDNSTNLDDEPDMEFTFMPVASGVQVPVLRPLRSRWYGEAVELGRRSATALERIATALESLVEFAPSAMFAASAIGDSVDQLGTSLMAQAVAAAPKTPPSAPAPRPAPKTPVQTRELPPASIHDALRTCERPGDMERYLNRFSNIIMWNETVAYFEIKPEVARDTLRDAGVDPNGYASIRMWSNAFRKLNVLHTPLGTWTAFLADKHLKEKEKAK